MNLSKAASILLATTISVGAFVPTAIRHDVATRSAWTSRQFITAGALKMSESAVIDAEPVTDADDGEKFE